MTNIQTFRYGYSQLTLRTSQHLQAVKIGKQKNEMLQQALKTHGFLGDFQLFEKTENELATTTSVYHPLDNHHIVIPTGKFYLVLKNKNEAQAAHQLCVKYNLKIEEELGKGELIVSSENVDPIGLGIALQKETALLECAEPDLMVSTEPYDFQLPTDELLSKQWYLDNTGKDPHGEDHWKYKKGADARVVEAWKILEEHKGFKSSEDITVAIIDKGFDLSHPDFQGKIVGAKDFHAERNSRIPKPFTIVQTGVDSEGKIDTDADHGTSCAGIAIGAANGKGVVGVAPNSKFMPIRYYLANGTTFREMFRHIMQHGGDVISCSFGHIGIPMDRLTIRSIHNCAVKGREGRGCVILFATGNAYTMLKNNELATHPDVIAVGASTSEDTLAIYSNRTKNMSVVAPGGYGHSGTMTTADVGFLKLGNGKRISIGKGREENPYYRNNAQGTSFACPLVAGVCALVLSANPDLTSFEVKKIIEETADKIGTPSEYDKNGHSAKFGYGRVNAANAVRKALGLPLVEYKVSSPDVSNIPDSIDFDYGTSFEGTHGADTEEVVIQYPILAEHEGKTLLIEVDTGFDHDPKKQFELYIQKNRKPVFFPNDFIAKHLSPTPKLIIRNVTIGTYFIMLRCFNKSESKYVKGGGDFEMNITLLPPMA